MLILTLEALLGSFIISLLVFTLLRKYFKKTWRVFGMQIPLKRMGGLSIAVMFAFLFTLSYIFFDLTLSKDYWSILAGIAVLAVGGIWDDVYDISWLKQLIFQSLAAFFLLLAGDTIDHIRLPGGEVFNFPVWLSYITAFVWIIIIINSLNWFDGTDGLAGSVSFITLITLAGLSFLPVVNQPGTALLCCIAAGLVLGFLFYNFAPSFMQLGTTGVWMLGFLIAAVSIYSGGKVATTALVLGLPLINFIFVSLERLIKGRYPFKGGDRLHLPERLEDRGWSNASIVVVISLISLLWGAGALLTQTEGKFFLSFSLLGIFLFFWLEFGLKPKQKRK